jgi:hypothetical protein
MVISFELRCCNSNIVYRSVYSVQAHFHRESVVDRALTLPAGIPIPARNPGLGEGCP